MSSVRRTASSRQLAARWSITTRVLKSASSIRRRLLHRKLYARLPLYKILLTANDRRMRLQWTHEHRAWEVDWHQVVNSDESRFSLWAYVDRIRVRRNVGECCLPEHPWSHIFQQDNARPHVAKTIRDFCSAQHMRLFPWPAYSPDMSPIEHVWGLVGRHLARDSCPASSKDELLLRIQAI
ncbi:transposable element Tcb2 transposase [Trichonephila clavipes]|nr:transposable element Tcb2 transposase [Trichonephila clavipes]